MGLDLIVEGRAKSGHDAEWRRLVEKTFAGEELSEAELGRLDEISVSAGDTLGAPRIGYDAAADAWLLKVREASTPEEVSTALETFHGYYALALVQSDGLPKYTHANLYDGVDESSFRGSFLEFCSRVLPDHLREDAWAHKWPESAVDFGQALLDAADRSERYGALRGSSPSRGLLARLGLGKRSPNEMSFKEQLDIVRSAGRWYQFWGERGHPIRAWG